MKRIIALLLVVVIAATVLSVTAFAAHRDGFYNGKSWKVNLNIYSRTQLVGTFSVQEVSSSALTTKMNINCRTRDGYLSKIFWDDGYVSWNVNSVTGGTAIISAQMTYIYKGLSGTIGTVA